MNLNMSHQIGRGATVKFDDVARDSLKEAVKILVSLTPLFAFWFISLGNSLAWLRIGIYTGIVLFLSFAV